MCYDHSWISYFINNCSFFLDLTLRWILSPQWLYGRQSWTAQNWASGEWSDPQLNSPLSRPYIPGKTPGPFLTCLICTSLPADKPPIDRLFQHPHIGPCNLKVHLCPRNQPTLRPEIETATACSGPRVAPCAPDCNCDDQSNRGSLRYRHWL